MSIKKPYIFSTLSTGQKEKIEDELNLLNDLPPALFRTLGT